MTRNAAVAQPFLEDQIDGKPMETRIARIESDVSHLKSDVSDIKADMRDMRTDIGAIKTEQAALRGELATLNQKIDGGFSTLREEMKAQINGLESKMIKWVVGTALGCAGLAFSIAKYIH